MGVGTDLNSVANLCFPLTKTPIKVTVERRSADYVWQGATIAAVATYAWELNYGPSTAAERDVAITHWKDNKGLTFPWTNPQDTVTYQVRYDPEMDEASFGQEQINNCRWTIRLLPAVT